MRSERASAAEGEARQAPLDYEPPSIAWEEDYEVTALGLTCVKYEGMTECIPGPFAG